MSLITEVFVDSSHTALGIYISPLLRLSRKYPNKVTTNEGEFLAMREALLYLKGMIDTDNWSVLTLVYTDSQLVAKCLTAGWHVKPQHLKVLHQECQELYHELHKMGVNIHWIPREKNKEADALTHE